MTFLLTLVIAGVLVGASYGLLGFALTLTFRSTGVLSFAHAGFALLASYLYSGFQCKISGGSAQCVGNSVLAPVPAAAVAVGATTAAALLVERFVIRPLNDRDSTTKSIATAAVLGLCAGIVLQIYGSTPRNVPPEKQLVPAGGFRLSNVFVSWQQLAILVSSIVLVALITLILRRSWLGLGVRAAGQFPEVARLYGISANGVARFNWAIAGAISGLAGVLITPVTVVNIGTFSFLLVKAVGAALIGGLVSLPLAFGGGIALGVVEAVVPRYWLTPGSGAVAIAGLVMISLIVNPHRLRLHSASSGAWVRTASSPSRGAFLGRGTSKAWSAVASIHALVRDAPAVLKAAAIVAGLAFPLRDEFTATLGVNVAFYFLIALSVLCITEVSGHPSLMQMGFAGIGAYAAATGLSKGLPFLGSVAIGVVVCFIVGALLGLAAFRLDLRGVEFAIVTLTLSALISDFVLPGRWLSNTMLAPMAFGFDLVESKNQYILSVALACLAGLLVRNVISSQWGSHLRASKEGLGVVLRHSGRDIMWSQSLLFGLSGAIAGIAGAVYALIVNGFTPFQFIPLASITVLLAAVVGGTRSIAGPLIAGVIFGVGPSYIARFSPLTPNAFPQIVASALTLLLIIWIPGGLADIFRHARERLSALNGRYERRPRFRGGYLEEEVPTRLSPGIEQENDLAEHLL